MRKRIIMSVCALMAMTSCQKKISNETETKSDFPDVVESVTTAAVDGSIPNSIAGSYRWGTTWIDNFTSLDTEKWSKIKLIKYPSSTSTVTARVKTLYKNPNMVSITAAGNLCLQSKKVNDTQLDVGMISTESSKSLKSKFKYGFYVARMYIQNPTTVGSQSSFWTSYWNDGTDNLGSADGCEMDVFESSFSGGKMASTYHWDWHEKTYGHQHKAICGDWIKGNATSGFHEYGLLWTSSKVEIYYDGLKVNSSITPYHISQIHQFLCLGTAHAWGDQTAADGFKNANPGTIGYTYVDWIKYIPIL